MRASVRVAARSAVGGLCVAIGAACSGVGQSRPESVGTVASASTVGGCECPSTGSCADISFSDVPADGVFYLTTFGGGSDTQPMACGGSADGTWAYVADLARFGCGAKLLVSANGKSCVAQVADCGPNQCVEQAAANSGCTTHHAVLDASPLIAQYLLGTDSAGWSDMLAVTVAVVASDSAIGCPAPVTPAGDSGTGAAEAGADAGDTSDADTDEASVSPDAAPPEGDATPPLDSGAHHPDARAGAAVDAGWVRGGAVLEGGVEGESPHEPTPPASDAGADTSGASSGGCSTAPGERSWSAAGFLGSLGALAVVFGRRRRTKVRG